MPWGTLTLVAGPNGAGKTTLVRSLKCAGGLESHTVLNADDRTLEKLRRAGFSGFNDSPENLLKDYFIEAANEVYDETLQRLKSGEMVSLETVLSTGKYKTLVELLQANQGIFELIYVALESPEVSMRRVALRVQKGGHDVPVQKLEERWKRSLEYLVWFAPKADRLTVYDNTVDPARVLVKAVKGLLTWKVSPDTVFTELRTALELAFKDSS